MAEPVPADETPSETLAEFVATLSYDTLPEPVVETVERAFLDTLGVAVAGSTTPAGRAARGMVAASGASGGGHVFGLDERVSLPEAALANGTAAHALDYDDVNEVVSAHPSAVLVPALLAVADARPSSGRDVVTAYVAGFETAARLGAAVNPAHYEAGWHATATLGAFGAAAASARLLELDTARIHHALNTVASTAAGLKRNFGTATKPLHAGQAARSGVTAAILAERGHTAADEAISGRRGFTDLYAGAPDATPRDTDNLYLAETGLSVKKFPCCYFTHAPAQAALDIAAATDLGRATVERVDVTVSRGAVDALQYDEPTTGDEAKFSLPYTVAHALAERSLGLSAFDPDRLGAAAVEELRARVHYEVDETLSYESFESTVTVAFDDRQRLSRHRMAPPGTPTTPLSLTELREKYEACVGYADGRVPAEMAEVALSLRSVDDVSSAIWHP